MIVIASAGRLAARASGTAATLGRRAAHIVRTAANRLRNRREVLRLREMDERSLGDIGLSRADVEGALSGRFWDDPSRLLGARDVERRAIVAGHARCEDRSVPVKDYSRTPAAC